MKKIFIYLGVLLFSNSCSLGGDDDNLSISRRNYDGNQIKIDGYFYQIFENKIYGISFFYENGIYLDIGGLKEDFADADNYIKKIIQVGSIQHSKFCWGVFKIEDDNLFFEKWYPSEKPYKVFVRQGKIVNDTTFVIKKSYRIENGTETNISDLDETYYYKKYNPKPNSDNDFVK